MKEKIKLAGFIKPLILIIIVALFVIGGTGYFTIEQYKKYQTEKIEKEKIAQEIQRQENLEVEQLRQEIEALKNKESQEDPEIEKLKQEIEVLKEKEPQVIREIIIKEGKTDSESNLASIIDFWKPRIANIRCYFYYNDGRLAHIQSGSGIGIYKPAENTVWILTNKHVITASTHWAPDYCISQFSGNFQKTYTSNTQQGDLRADPNGLDVGFVRIRNPDPSIRDFILTICSEKAELGAKILILGYPVIGSTVDITVTEGIISGYDGDYYITSAKVEQGHSGGVAVLIKNNCYLGIPTFAQVGAIESLARILDNNAFVDNFFK